MSELSLVVWCVSGEVFMFVFLYLVSAWYVYSDTLNEPAGSIKRRVLLKPVNTHAYVLSDTGARVASGMAVDLWKKLQALPLVVVAICLAVM